MTARSSSWVRSCWISRWAAPAAPRVPSAWPSTRGTYEEIEFEIHNPSDDDATDVAFLQAHPDFAGVSVKVTGSFNGAPFSYLSDLNAKEEIELNPPLVTTESAATDLTLMVDLDRWFRDGCQRPGGSRERQRRRRQREPGGDNIQGTLHAFEDEDHDGTDDHGGPRRPSHD